MMFDIRCCEEEDCPDILTYFKDNVCATFIKEKYEFSELEKDLIEGNQQWYCIELRNNNEMILGIARLTIIKTIENDAEIIQSSIPILSFASSIKDEKSINLIYKCFVSYLEEVSKNLSASKLIIEITDRDFNVQDYLVENGYIEIGGYFESGSMIFKMMKILNGDNIAISNENMTDIEVLESFESEQFDELGNPSMQHLIEDLFTALHKSDLN